MSHTWSKINGFPNYSVSNTGKIRNDLSGKIKSPIEGATGYLNIDLYSGGKRTKAKIHRLVGEAFIPNPDNKPEVNHIDGDKHNNNVENLEWVTHSENIRHAFSTGLMNPSRSMLGRKNPNAGRPGKPIRIIETGEEFNSITECEKAINGNNRHICDCLSGRQKTHKGYHFEYI